MVITQFILAYAVRDWDWWKVRCGSAGMGLLPISDSSNGVFVQLFWSAVDLPGLWADGTSTLRVWLMLPPAPTNLSQHGQLFLMSALPTQTCPPVLSRCARCGWPPTC